MLRSGMPSRAGRAERLTSRDVALRAGVSQATVSAVLNHRRYVNPELVDRVRRAAHEVGYRPNGAARALKTGRARTIGMVVPNILSPFWSSFVRSANRAAAERGLNVLLSESGEDDDTERRTLLALLEREVDGLLLGTRGAGNGDVIEDIVRRHLPVVLIDSPSDGLSVDSLTVDDEASADMGTAHLPSSMGGEWRPASESEGRR